MHLKYIDGRSTWRQALLIQYGKSMANPQTCPLWPYKLEKAKISIAQVNTSFETFSHPLHNSPQEDSYYWEKATESPVCILSKKFVIWLIEMFYISANIYIIGLYLKKDA